MTPTDKIIAYLEGRTPLKTCYDEVLEPGDLQNFLERDACVAPYTNDGNLFLFMMDQNPDVLESDLNIRDALSKLLGTMGIAHQADDSSARDYDLVLAAAPSWLHLPPEYAAGLLAGIPQALGRAARLKAAKEAIAKDFRYLKKPPRWLQDAPWPVADGKPLLFVGQVPMDGVLHDTAAVYVFFNPADGSVRTILQTA